MASGEGVAEHVEAVEGRAGIAVDAELGHIEGVDGEEVAVRAVTARRCSADKALSAAVVSQLNSACWEAAAFVVAGPAR